MDYVKRDKIRNEIDILINRIVVLQDQEKSYEDLSGKISNLNLTIKAKDKIIKERESRLEKLQYEQDKKIIEKKALIADLSDIDKELNKKKNDVKIEIEHYHKQQTITKDLCIKKDKELLRLEDRIKRTQQEYVDELDKLSNIKDNLGREQKEILNKIDNNQSIINKQRIEISEYNDKIEQVKSDFKELDIEYQKLLENYIVTE